MEKPNVFPTSIADKMKEANEMGTRIANQANDELNTNRDNIPLGEMSADEQIKKNTADNLEKQINQKNKLIARNKEIKLGNEVEDDTRITYADTQTKSHKTMKMPDEDKYVSLSQPQLDVPFDVIKLPSEGLLYKNHGGSLKVAYLTAMDESIITNPNLLRSGKFLEVLINRKMMDLSLRYNDLHVGDRNAIMIWLRSTGYGPMYNIKLSDPTDNHSEFEVEIDLSKLPIKYLTEKPDENGHFNLILPLSQKTIKFKLLTVGDIEDVEDYVENIGDEFVDASTYTLKKQIVSVDGDYSEEVINNFIERGMRIGDVRTFRQYINEIESGIDMNITVGTPGGGSVKTFLPLNTSFFWPDLGI